MTQFPEEVLKSYLPLTDLCQDFFSGKNQVFTFSRVPPLSTDYLC